MARILTIMMLFLATGCSSKLVVRPITVPGSLNEEDEGVYYSLPQTVLSVDVPVMRRRTILGEFSELVPVFFPFDDPPAADVTYSLGEPALGAFGAPDPAHVYLAVIKGGTFEDKKLALNFGEDGTIDMLEAESTNRTLEFVGQLVKSAAAIGAKFPLVAPAAAPPPPAPGEEPAPLPADCAAIETLLGGPSSSLAQRARDRCLGLPPPLQSQMRSYVANGAKPDQLDARARTFIRGHESAIRLDDLRALRSKLLTLDTLGAAVGDPLKSALEEIDAEIDGIMAKFFGTEEEKTYWKASYQVTPMANFSAGAIVVVPLFRYSPTHGVCQPPPSPVPPQVDVLETLPPPARSETCPKEITLELDITRPPQQYADTVSAAGPRAGGERGLFYRIPGKGHATLHIRRTTDDGTTRSGRLHYQPSLAQFGTVVSLPATTGGRKTQYAANFYSETGALKSFKLDSEAQLDKAIVTDLGEAASTVIDARTARLETEREEREAREQAADELTLLKREADMLETRVRINEAQRKLAPPADATED